MALNIPMPDLPGNALMKGLETGGNLFSKIMQARNAQKANQLHPSGDVANALFVEQVRKQYGENSPEYLQAKAAHELMQQNRSSLINWRRQSSNLAPYRVTSPLGRSILEAKGQGAFDRFGNPQNNNQLGQQQYDQNGNPIYINNMDEQTKKAYEADIAKKTTDAAIRNKLPYAENVETTFNNLNFNDLTTYSGLKGSIDYAKDFALAGMGNPSERFLKYNDAVNTASALSKQLRQFWGDSIQPTAMEKIDSLTNPSRWYKDPKVAKSQLEQLKRITDQELENFRKAGTSPVKLNKLDYKNGKFTINETKNQYNALKNSNYKRPQNNDEDNQILSAASAQLIEIFPDATPENIKLTAEEQNISIDEAINQLLQLRDAELEKKNGRS